MRTSDLLPAQLYLKVAVVVWECQYTSSCPLSPSLLSLKDSTLPGVMPCGCPSCTLCSRISSSSTMCSYPHGRPSPFLSSVCLACAFLFYYRTPFAGGAGCKMCISFYAHMPLLLYLWMRAQAGVYDIQSTIASIFFCMMVCTCVSVLMQQNPFQAVPAITFSARSTSRRTASAWTLRTALSGARRPRTSSARSPPQTAARYGIV